MTAKRRLVPRAEVEEAISIAKAHGIEIGAIDIRSDGVTIHPATNRAQGNDFDRWFSKDKNRDETTHRQ